MPSSGWNVRVLRRCRRLPLGGRRGRWAVCTTRHCRSPRFAERSVYNARARVMLFLLRLPDEMEILAVSFLLHLLHRHEAQRRRIHAVTQAGRLGSIVEDVAEMGIVFF